MKITLTEAPAPNMNPYPGLYKRVGVEHNLIILAVSAKAGMVVESDSLSFKVGYFFGQWTSFDQSIWKRIYGKVELDLTN
jgi:hypothetical protein